MAKSEKVAIAAPLRAFTSPLRSPIARVLPTSPCSLPPPTMVKRYYCLTSGQRSAVEQLALRGISNAQIADQLHLSKLPVAKIYARVRWQGDVGPPLRPGRPRILHDQCRRRMRRMLRGG